MAENSTLIISENRKVDFSAINNIGKNTIIKLEPNSSVSFHTDAGTIELSAEENSAVIPVYKLFFELPVFLKGLDEKGAKDLNIKSPWIKLFMQCHLSIDKFIKAFHPDAVEGLKIINKLLSENYLEWKGISKKHGFGELGEEIDDIICSFAPSEYVSINPPEYVSINPPKEVVPMGQNLEPASDNLE